MYIGMCFDGGIAEIAIHYKGGPHGLTYKGSMVDHLNLLIQEKRREPEWNKC